jgi:Flp pilus assembly protein TadG
VLIFGIVDIGRAFYTQSALTAAVREGARYGAAQAASAPVVNDTFVIRRVKNAFSKFGGPSSDSITAVTVSTPVPGNSYQVSVTATFRFTWITPLWRFVNQSGTSARNFSATANYRWEGAP